MQLHFDIAWSHLRTRRRQTIASLLGVVLGVAFFLAVSSLMRGSEIDFIARLVDSTPHITVSDEFRDPTIQPAVLRNPEGAVSVLHVKPLTERRGIRQYKRRLEQIDAIAGLRAAPVLIGQAIFSFAGRDEAVTLSGIEPARMKDVTTIEEDIVAGSLEAIDTDPNGIIIGRALARKLSLAMGDTVSVVSPVGNVRVMRIVGLFHTGRAAFDESQAYAQLARVQALLNRPNVANTIIARLEDPYAARATAAQVERLTGYKSVSWQEASEDILSTLLVRNVIMYSVVSAILLVASFGIYNVISSVIMEKTRDIAILKSMGFRAGDIEIIFLIEGLVVGAAGSILGFLAGSGLMWATGQVRLTVPGESDPVNLPVYWGWNQFALAMLFAMLSALAATYLPARRGARLAPVAILRGAA